MRQLYQKIFLKWETIWAKSGKLQGLVQLESAQCLFRLCWPAAVKADLSPAASEIRLGEVICL